MNRVLTFTEAKALEFCVYEQKGAGEFYPVMTVGDRIAVADEWDTWDGVDESLCGKEYRFWAHYPTPDELAAWPWENREARNEAD